MRISTNWLQDYVEPGWSADELADRLTMSGLEVESVEQVGSDFDGVVVGHVLEVSRHPDADRLSVCRVQIAEGGDPVQIVCGAPNVAAGQRVPVATVGTVLELPDRSDPEKRQPVTLKRTKIRGQESSGMICAEDELGLSDNHEGIMVLGDDAEIGLPFAAWLARTGVPTSDVSIDISITPNRPDAVCHLGVARDVSALAEVDLRVPDVTVPEAGGLAESQIAVRIDAPDGCHRYAGILVRDVTIAESPAWLRSRLETIGLRPRNNVVDITNYVMYECGQPLHAFDYDQIAGQTIVVRRTSSEGPFTTLDGKERTLDVGTLMIADADRDVAIAGVMGGENSEVSDSTTNVLIESAWFEPSGVRRTAKKLQLQTDASYRFERGVDPTGQAWAAARAAELMRDLAGGTIVDGMVDCHPAPWEPRSVILRSARIAHVLGREIPDSESVRILAALGFDPKSVEAGWDVGVPANRPDVTREIDLIEEVARINGLDRIEEPAHSLTPNERMPAPVELTLRDRLSDHLVGLGYRETCTNSMLRRDRAEAFASGALRGGGAVGDVVLTMNPISQEMAALRPSLLPGLLQVTAHNLNHGQPGVRLFEFGNVFDRSDDHHSVIQGFREQEHLLVVAAGADGLDSWGYPASTAQVFDVKGVAESLLAALGIGRLRLETSPAGSDLTRYHLDLGMGRQHVATVGCLDPTLCSELGINQEVYFAELNFSAITRRGDGSPAVQYQPVSRFPVVDRDLAVVVGDSEPVGDMLATVRRGAGALLRNVRVFDIYRGKGVEEGSKSVAIALEFAADRTLRDAEVDKAVSRVVKALATTHGAVLRA